MNSFHFTRAINSISNNNNAYWSLYSKPPGTTPQLLAPPLVFSDPKPEILSWRAAGQQHGQWMACGKGN